MDGSEELIIGYHLRVPGFASLRILDEKGETISHLLNHKVKNAGYFTKRITTKKLDNSKYTIELQTGGEQFEKSIE